MSRTAAKLPSYPYPPDSISRGMLSQVPDDYRATLVRTMAMQAYAERLGTTELGPWIAQAPGYRQRRLVARIAADEAAHSFWLYRELELMGVSESEALDIAEGRTGQGAARASLDGPREVTNDDNLWIDVILNHMFLDRAGHFMVTNFSTSSYAPWARVCRRILRDEAIHISFGYHELQRELAGSYDEEDLSRRITRWFALGLNFFGPPKSSRTRRLKDLGLKRQSNEQLRRAYRKEVIQAMEGLGARHLIKLSRTAFPYA